MALSEAKFRLSKIVLSAMVFISLCVPTTAEAVRRCYWCGPLAEQVHRSQRAPPCNEPYGQVTVCDAGFPYCAIVATSPPYMESRYCVKLYQDECYTLYCNSTKTWRMTCPCRGDLCNGPNTDREEDAFAGLAKLVARTQNTRTKRALISSSGFIGMINTNRRNRIDNTTEENKNISSNMIDDSDIENNNNDENQIIDTTIAEDNNIENKIIDSTVTTETEVKIAEETISETNPTTAETVEENTQSNINTVQTTVDETVKIDDNQIQPIIQIDIPPVNIVSSDLKTEIIVLSSETSKTVNDASDVSESIIEIKPTTAEIMKETTTEAKSMAETTVNTAKITTNDEKVVVAKIKPTEQLPTAEALQHNDTPTVKATEQATTMSTVMSSKYTEAPTQTNSTHNNTAIRLDARVLPLAIGIILNF